MHADRFVPIMDREGYPKPLSELYNPGLLTNWYLELLKECETVFSPVKVCYSCMIITYIAVVKYCSDDVPLFI